MEVKAYKKESTQALFYRNSQSSDEEIHQVYKKAKLSNDTVKFIKSTNHVMAKKHSTIKRARRQNSLLSNYKMDSDTDSDDNVKCTNRSRGLNQRKKGKIQPGQNKLELILNWKKEMIINEVPKDKECYKIIKTENIFKTELKNYAQDLQAIYINIKWQTKFESNGVSIKDFEKLDLNRRLMRNGIVFIWSEKEVLWDIIKIMEEKGFNYIENLAVIMLDESKLKSFDPNKKNHKQIQVQQQQQQEAKKLDRSKITSFFKAKTPVSTTASEKTESQESAEENKNYDILDVINKNPNVEADQIYYEGESEYFKKAKKVLLMFRRNESKEANLELRHQRTSDAVFDIINKKNFQESGLNTHSKEYVYKMIETLLPKANYQALTNKQLKMMELWADPEKPREGWISICE